MSPGLDAGVAMLALVLASQRDVLWPAQAQALAASASPWRNALVTAVAALLLYCVLKIAVAHLMPFRHVDAVDAASSRYRILMALLLGAAIVMAVSLRHATSA